MKRILLYYIWSILLFYGLGDNGITAQTTVSPFKKNRAEFADSIMDRVLYFVPFYERVIGDYEAELYIKSKLDIEKKNFAIRYLPDMFPVKNGVREYMVETLSDLQYTAPNIYTQHVKGEMGTAANLWELDGRLLEHFRLNIYSPTLLYDKLLSPLAPNARRYYNYYADSIMGEPFNRSFKIRFVPKQSSFQLLEGYMIVSDNVWSIREIYFKGRSETLRFNNLLKMGNVGEADEFLPIRYDASAQFRFVGNRINGNYTAVLDYKNVHQHSPTITQRDDTLKNKYDLTKYFVIQSDSRKVSPALKDSVNFELQRPIPLTTYEQSLYDNYRLTRDTVITKKRSFWNRFGGILVDYYTVDLDDWGRIRCSPLINPLMFGYSARNGLSYRQRFRYRIPFSNDRSLNIVPGVGYNFKMKEFYWNVATDWNYNSAKFGSLRLDFGNGNRIYSSTKLDDMKNMPDSVFDFDKFKLRYYKDLYLTLRHRKEIINGLLLDINLSIHHRTDNSDNFAVLDNIGTSFPSTGLPPNFYENIWNVHNRYKESNSFAPGIRLSWTPGQYYYIKGNSKVNLKSKYPTISFDWERSIDGILPHSSEFERFEVDVQYDVSLGILRNLYTRLGWGVFSKQDDLYFVDFANFRPFNLPTGWHDDFGGIFHLLDRRWYNSSRKYARAHITYEAPFLLLPHFTKTTQYVLNERLYLGALLVPHLKPYIEAGYGIGTHIFDVGFFVSFANWKHNECGIKFTFELFNR